jgi:hypothetical protein
MIKRLAAFLAFALITAVASAAPVITSVTPNSSTVNGGIHVTIKGDGFAICPICSPPVPPVVTFGLTPSSAVRLLDVQTLDVVVPVHLPGTVDVNVLQFDGTATAPNAFTFTGDVSDAFETILVPIFSPPVRGAFGSEFHTIVRAANKSDTFVTIYGIDTSCMIIDPPQYPSGQYTLTGMQELQLPTDCSQWPARFLYVPKTMASSLTLNDRVLDVSRSTLSNGTEIPIVRSARFTSNRIVLLGIPIDGRFRSTLRVYGMKPMTVDVSVGGQQPRGVELKAGADVFEPAYGTFSDFPIPVDPGSEGTTSVTIDPPPGPPIGVFPTPPGPPIWAFITVTNNQTQEITTITPDN